MRVNSLFQKKREYTFNSRKLESGEIDADEYFTIIRYPDQNISSVTSAA